MKAALLAAGILFAGVAAQGATVKQCGMLRELKLPNVTRLEAASVPAGSFTPPGQHEPVVGGSHLFWTELMLVSATPQTVC